MALPNNQTQSKQKEDKGKENWFIYYLTNYKFIDLGGLRPPGRLFFLYLILITYMEPPINNQNSGSKGVAITPLVAIKWWFLHN
jgi:hypothetical protein